MIAVKIVSPLRADAMEFRADPAEPVSLLRQHLQSLSPLAQPVAAFHLTDTDGATVDLEAPISSLGEEPELRLVVDPLTPADVQAQLSGVRSLLGFTDACEIASVGATQLDGLLAAVSHSKTKGSKNGEKGSEKSSDKDSLGDISMGEPERAAPVATPNEPERLARQLELSAWNPVSHLAKLRWGHLAYVRFVPLDGKVRHLVATPAGWAHVPRLTEDHWPADSEWPDEAAGGLWQHSLFALIAQLSPQTDQAVRRANKLLSQQDPLQWVPVRTVDAAIPWLVEQPSRPVAHAFAVPASANGDREWNEDYQVAHELPRESVRERVTRERQLVDVATAFGTVAAQGARDVVEGALAPLNPDESPDAYIYLRGGIFYLHAQDFAGQFSELGGNEAAAAAARKDLQGVEQLMLLDIKGEDGVCPVLTAVIDLCGRRIVAQAPIPGVFRESAQSQVAYGWSEDHETLLAEPEFGSALEFVAKPLHLAKHTIAGSEMVTSADVRGMRGTDCRRYAIDLYRLAPPDLAWLADAPADYPHRIALIRPEAVAAFYAANPDAAGLNPDGWLPETPEADRKTLDSLATFVREAAAKFVSAVSDGSAAVPLDGGRLSAMMHHRGINMRYLGLVATKATAIKSPATAALARVAEFEALTRAAKHVLRARLNKVELWQAAAVAESFFAELPWSEIVAEAQRRFNLDAGARAAAPMPSPAPLEFVRSVSMKMGLQWTPDRRVVGVQPVVRYAYPRSAIASEAIDAGRHTEDATVVAESVAVVAQVYGSVHAEVARAHSEAALQFYAVEDWANAVEHGRKAVTVAERTLGLDNVETVLMYMNLAQLERGSGNNRVALALFRHALGTLQFLVPVVNEDKSKNGSSSKPDQELPPYPISYDVHHALQGVGTVLQQVRRWQEAMPWFERALALADALNMPPSLRGPTYYVLAVSQANAHEFAASARSMEHAYESFKAANDTESQEEAKKQLDVLLKATVQAPKIAALKQNMPATAARPAPKSKPKSAAKSRNINDIVSYIMGDAKTPSKASGKAKGKK